MSTNGIQDKTKDALPSEVLNPSAAQIESWPLSGQPTQTEASSSSSSSASKVFTEEEITTKFEKAKQLFKDGTYIEASDLLCDVLEFRVQKFGDLAIECAGAYYLYGRSLFLGAAGTLQEKLADAGGSDDEDETEEKEEAVESLEVAWEVLESARVAYEKEVSGHELELSDVYNALYELSSENGQDGIPEAEKCVELRKKVLPPHNRDLAVAHYTLALALFAAGRKCEAHDNFKRAFEILSAFIANCPADSPTREEVKGVLEDLKQTIAEFDFSEPPLAFASTPSALLTTSPSNPSTSFSSSSPKLVPQESSFAAPTMANNANVHFLGMVGKSAKRTTASNTATTSLPLAVEEGGVREKRKCEFAEPAIERKQK